MHGREFFSTLLNSYFTLVTLISICMLTLGMYFYPNKTCGYDAFAFPLIYAACGILPEIVMYSKRELSVVEFLIRKVIELVLIEGIILFVTFYGGEKLSEEKYVVIATGIAILVIFVISHIVDWIQKCLSAKEMTDDLRKLQEKFNG